MKIKSKEEILEEVLEIAKKKYGCQKRTFARGYSRSYIATLILKALSLYEKEIKKKLKNHEERLKKIGGEKWQT